MAGSGRPAGAGVHRAALQAKRQGKAGSAVPVAAGVLLAATAVSLQGCAMHDAQEKLRDVIPMDCPERTFAVEDATAGAGIGWVRTAAAGEPGIVRCPPGLRYAGPELECSWVGKVCLVEKGEQVTQDTCFNDFAFTTLGAGLTEWPAHLEPVHYHPSEVSWHLQVRKRLAVAKRQYLEASAKAAELQGEANRHYCKLRAKMNGEECQEAGLEQSIPIISTTTFQPRGPLEAAPMPAKVSASGAVDLPKPIASKRLTCVEGDRADALVAEEERRQSSEEGILLLGAVGGVAAALLGVCCWAKGGGSLAGSSSSVRAQRIGVSSWPAD